ncbi:MAG: TonB C-terminal domain-containing protein [bacterium]
MTTREGSIRRSWIWAIGINLVVFTALGIFLTRLPEPKISLIKNPVDIPSGNQTPTGPGGTFGQMTHLIGDTSTGSSEDISSGTPTPIPDGNETQATLPNNTQIAEPVQKQVTDQWVTEFYLDKGPPISFAVRLNPDGTPRPHPTEPDRAKAPTYESPDSTFTTDDINLPVMSPQFFSKRDLPDEFRSSNLELTVRIRLDRRGRIQGTPTIIKSTGSTTVDAITLKKITEEVTFSPATRKSTGEPIEVTLPSWPIFWLDVAK